MRARASQPVILALVTLVAALGLNTSTGPDQPSAAADNRQAQVLLRDEAGEPVGW